VGTVTAQNNDGRHPLRAHPPGRTEGVFDRRSDVHVQEVHLGELVTQASLALEAPGKHGADPALVRHHENLVHPATPGRGEQPQDDVDTVGDLQIVGVGDDPADVTG
jgi:hypothetical protein